MIKLFITSDNPRTENPLKLLKILKREFQKIIMRLKKIGKKLSPKLFKSSNEDAVILIAGKGHENYQEINGIRNHFSDQEIAIKYLAE